MSEWLTFMHHVGKGSAYLRVKVWRELRAIGALQVRNSAWMLPSNSAACTTLVRLLRTVEASGGSAVVAESRLVAGMTDGQLIAAFQAARDRDYFDLIGDLPVVKPGARPTSVRRAEIAAAIGRARRRLQELQTIDYFAAPAREAAAAAISALEHRLIPAAVPAPRRPGLADLRDRVWVTRANVHVDRMACAWLIRRFLDPQARFRFVPGLSYRARKNEVRFDMADAEFTHEGDRCSFEVLHAYCGRVDDALRTIAEIVHTLDVADDKFERPEASGLGNILAGIVAAHRDDAARIERAGAVFDDLYASFRHPAPGKGRRRGPNGR